MEIKEAVAFFGNQSKVARALGTGVNTVANWKIRGNVIPMPVQWQIELGTGGALKADEPPLMLSKKAIKELAGRK